MKEMKIWSVKELEHYQPTGPRYEIVLEGPGLRKLSDQALADLLHKFVKRELLKRKIFHSLELVKPRKATRARR